MRLIRSLQLLLVAALLATGAVLPFATTAETRPGSYFFEAELTSTSAGLSQLFFDLGKDFNETDSSVQQLAAGTAPATYRFMIPATEIRGLRFDPIDRAATLTISHPRIVDSSGRVRQTFSLAQLKPVQQLDQISTDGENVRFATTPDANDPILSLALTQPLQLTSTRSQQILALLPPWLAIAAAVVVFSLLLDLPPARRALDVIRLLASRPVIALALCATLAIAVQCFPVIFCGRSFVSPNNGSPFLYESFPTLPGSTNHHVEDTKGSDVAAMFHWGLYCPSIQREALFEHGELPLWNRYFVCGIPEMGQGQSMFGSVLNMIPLLGDSASWAWDLRYVLNRWLFVFGLGIATWLLTRSLPAALGLTAAGAFIGFFGFRLNHMAQFSVEASPWVIVGWLLLRDACTSRRLAGALAILALGSWEVLNSGTVKEAYMLLASTNVTGLLILLTCSLPLRERLRRLGLACLAGVLALAIASPLLLSFYQAFRDSYTLSNTAAVAQAPAWQLIGFFDDIFYAQLNPLEWRSLPSTNWFVFAGLGWALVGLRASVRDRAFLCLLAAALTAASLVFGIIPASVILRIPVLRNLQHVHNVFSCVLVVLAPLLAGFGIRSLVTSRGGRRWWLDCALLAVLLALPAFWYFRKMHGAATSPFFHGYFPSLIIGLLAFHLAVAFSRRSRARGLLIVGVAGSLALLLWRHGQQTSTVFDPYVVNPQPRVDFRAPSAAVKIVDGLLRSEPSRPAGLGMNMLAGYSEMLGWESIYGVDAVRSRYYDQLAAAGSISKLFWPAPDLMRSLGGDPKGWHEDRLPQLLPVQNMLNVRYYLGTKNLQPPSEGLTFIAGADLDVYESPGAWPRAFFTNDLFVSPDAFAFVDRLRSPRGRRPFAGISAETYRALPGSVAQAELQPRVSSPARDYAFTSNTTEFTVDAASAGVVVLTESFYEDDFKVFLNGKPTSYFRANEAFKGVFVPSPGTYQVRFEYSPRGLGVTLVLSAAGFLLALAGLLHLALGAPSRAPRTSPGTPA